MKYLKQLIIDYRAAQFTSRKIRTAYLIKDVFYLLKAYKQGRRYTKRLAIDYLEQIPTQKSFDFLIEEIKTLKDHELKIDVYHALIKMSINDQIYLSDEQALYLSNHIDFL